ncbi:MAG: PAS domain S-box protein [Ignavibacteriales bacterium]
MHTKNNIQTDGPLNTIVTQDYNIQDVYFTLLGTSPQAIIITDLSGKIIEISQSALDIHGYTDKKELLGNSIYNLIAPEDHQKASDCREKVLNECISCSIEYLMLKSNGSRFTGEVSTSLVRNNSGAPVYFVTLTRDITYLKHEQKKQSAIYEISEAANAAKSLNELFTRVHSIIKELIPAKNFYIALYNEKDDTLSFPYYVDEYDTSSEPKQYAPEKFGHGLTEYAILNEKPLLVNREMINELVNNLQIEKIGELAVEWLGVPLRTNDEKTIGVLAVQNYDERIKYTREDQEILAFVSTQIALAIERKRADEILQESQERYKVVISNLPDIILVYKKGQIIFANQTAVRFSGYCTQEFIGKSLFDFIPEDYQQLAIDKVNNRIKGNTLPDYEIVICTKSGERKNVIVRGTRILYQNEQAFLIVLFDVTERKRNEEDLIKLKKALEGSSEVIFITDPEGVITFINPAFTQLYGYTPEEVVGKLTPRILKSGVHSNDVYDSFWKTIRNKQSVNGELINRNKDGKLINIEGSASAILDENGNVIGYLGIQRDINERINTDKVRNALYKISEAANTATEISVLYKTIHEIIKELMPVKNFYIALYDPMSELLSFPYFVDEFDPPQKTKKIGKGLTEYVLRTGKGALIDEFQDLELRQYGEVEVIGTPSKIWLGVPLKVMDNITGVMVVQDYENPHAYGEKEKEILTFVSEQIASAIYKKSVEQELLEYTTDLQYHKSLLEKRTEELTGLNSQLEDSEKELQEMIVQKDKFFSILAHDLKSPFNGLLGFSNLLLQDFEHFSNIEIRNFVQHMNNSVKNIYELIENLLDWSRLQTGRIEFNPEELSLREKVESISSLLRNNAITKGIQISNTINKGTFVIADEKMLQCILQNLISNAIKFTGTNGKITISAISAGDFVNVSISDTGVGISKETIAKFFKIDTHISTEGTAREKGTGLGLIICKEFIEKNGGKISLESQLGKGTTFSFTLPSVKK